VNVNQKIVHAKTEAEKVFGFMGERLEVIETEVDMKYCSGCGKKLSIQL